MQQNLLFFLFDYFNRFKTLTKTTFNLEGIFIVIFILPFCILFYAFFLYNYSGYKGSLGVVNFVLSPLKFRLIFQHGSLDGLWDDFFIFFHYFLYGSTP